MPDKARPLAPGTPACMPDLPAGTPRNRLGLARWLVAPEQSADRPGRGQPDLAASFRHRAGEDGGELRRPGRAAAPSRAARLAGDRAGPDRLGREGDAPADRHQRDLSPGVAGTLGAAWRTTRRTGCWPAGRGSGSRPRSCATTPLAVAGLLTRRLGGPSVKPYQPAGLWEELAGGAGEGAVHPGQGARTSTAAACTSTGSGPCPIPRWRPSTRPAARPARSSAPGRIRRSRRLELLNDVAYVEAARALAQRMLDEGGCTPEERIAYAFRLDARPRADGGRAGRPAAGARSVPGDVPHATGRPRPADPPRREPDRSRGSTPSSWPPTRPSPA